jgi:hypothetical protein
VNLPLEHLGTAVSAFVPCEQSSKGHFRDR